MRGGMGEREGREDEKKKGGGIDRTGLNLDKLKVASPRSYQRWVVLLSVPP